MSPPPRRLTDAPDVASAPRGGRRAAWTVVLRVLLVVGLAALGALFFGLCVPFFLLAVKVLPSLGVAGVVYVFVGGLFGLLFGGITSAVSLARSERPVTRYYVITFGALAILTSAYYVAYLHFDALQHV